MALWLAPKKAADYLKRKDPGTQISERAIRRFVEDGFPCVMNGTRVLVNVDTFDEDLRKLSLRKILEK